MVSYLAALRPGALPIAPPFTRPAPPAPLPRTQSKAAPPDTMLQDTDDHKRPRNASVATRVINANNNSLKVASLVVIMSILSLFLTAAAVVYSRPTSISRGVLVANGGGSAPVQTGIAVTVNDLFALPASPRSTFEHLKAVTYPTPVFDNGDTDPSTTNDTTSKTVVGWHWTSTTRMVLDLENDATLLLDSGSYEVLEKPTGMVSFDGMGGNVTSGDPEGNPAASVDDVAERCAANGCPLAQCTGLLSVGPGSYSVKEVKCGDVSVWSWPKQVTLTPETGLWTPPAAGDQWWDTDSTTESTTDVRRQLGSTGPYGEDTRWGQYTGSNCPISSAHSRMVCCQKEKDHYNLVRPRICADGQSIVLHAQHAHHAQHVPHAQHAPARNPCAARKPCHS
jgi:hypothetical protein